MPKDTQPSDTSEIATKGPLKRGDACLYCRQRRRKCSATKPSCDYCVKLDRECVYDSGKPVSRVKQLEERLAELEGMLKSGSAGEAGGSSSSNGNGSGNGHPPLEHQSSSGYTASSSDSVPSYSAPPTSRSAYPNSIPTFPSNQMFNNFQNGPDINMDISSNNFFTGINPSNMLPNFGSSLLGDTNMLPGVNGNANLPSPGLFDFSTLDPTFMDLVGSFQNTSTSAPTPLAPPIQPPQRPPIVFNNGLQQFQGNLPGLNTYNQPAGSQLPVPPPNSEKNIYQAYVTDIFDSTPPSTGYTPPAGGDNDICGDNPRVSQAIGVKAGDHQSPDYVGNQGYRSMVNGAPGYNNGQGEKGWRADPELEGVEKGLVGGWFDANDLPKVARDHLLDLFFSGMRMFGQEFHVPRFYASLTLPIAKRPHPCLLYSMYLMAARISPSPPIRSLEPHFYAIASKQLDEAVTHGDRYFDATRAATILAVYKYSLARYHEGFMLTGMASRLAVSCGLHQISSSVFKPSTIPTDKRSDLMGIMRQRAFIIPPPLDPVELGERIWAFWSIYTVDRCGSIAAQWPPAIPDDIVVTPYPRPLHEYELGLVSETDNYSISTLYDPIRPPAPPFPQTLDSANNILRLRAITILERSSKLMYLKPEPSVEPLLRFSRSQSNSVTPPSQIDEYLSFQNWAFSAEDFNMMSSTQSADYLDNQSLDEASRRSSTSASASTFGPGSGTTTKASTRTAKVRNPIAYAEVRLALERIEQDLPEERRTNWEVWDGKVQEWHFGPPKKDFVTLHFILGCAWMFLFDVYSFNAENTAAVGVARRLVFTIRAVMGHPMNTDLDVFIAMTWSFIVKILIREVKRLQSIGDQVSAGPIEAEVETIVQALKIFGQRYSIAGVQALRAERYRKSTLDEMSFMRDDDLDDEHVQVEAPVGRGQV